MLQGQFQFQEPRTLNSSEITLVLWTATLMRTRLQ